jgi:hypothetical protein
LRDVGDAPRSMVRECRSLRKFPNYMVLMSSIIYIEPSSFKELVCQQVWRDAMVAKYTYIMRNNVWDIVPRLEGKLVVSSRCLYKINHVVYGSIENFKEIFVVRELS